MAKITEVAPDLFRLNDLPPTVQSAIQSVLVRDEEPLLFHTGPRALFADVKDAVASLIDVRRLRWISFSHFEADECGSPAGLANGLLRSRTRSVVWSGKWLVWTIASRSVRRRGWRTGRSCTRADTGFNFWRRRMCRIAGSRSLIRRYPSDSALRSDLFHQAGNGEPTTQSDVVGAVARCCKEYQQGPLANYMPYCTLTEPTLTRLAALKPNTLATMHGSVFVGDGAQARYAI